MDGEILCVLCTCVKYNYAGFVFFDYIVPFPCSMHVLPASHGRGVYKHDADSGFHIDYGMVDLPNPNDVGIYKQLRRGNF